MLCFKWETATNRECSSAKLLVFIVYCQINTTILVTKNKNKYEETGSPGLTDGETYYTWKN